MSGSVTNTQRGHLDRRQRLRLRRRHARSPPAPSWPRSASSTRPQPVGERITAAGHVRRRRRASSPASPRSSPSRCPGPSSRSARPGVYWFGVHALGAGTGRPRRHRRRPGPHVHPAGAAAPGGPSTPRWSSRSGTTSGTTSDGSIADVEQWAADLDTGGALRTLVDFGASAGSRPVTWLVDPAVPDTVQALVAGNPPRSLADTRRPPEPDDGGGDDEAASARAGPDGRARAERVADAGPRAGARPPANAATEPGQRLAEPAAGGASAATRSSRLPYGDVDVSAAAEWDPQVYEAARRRSGTPARPVGAHHLARPSAAPSGFVDPERHRRAPPAGHDPGHRRDVRPGRPGRGPQPPGAGWSSPRRPTRAGPGPATRCPRSPCASRSSARPRCGCSPPGASRWSSCSRSTGRPTSTTGFFEGLDVPWVNLTDVDGLDDRPGGRVAERPARPTPSSQVRRELDAANFTSAADLVAAGETLQNVLTRNNSVAADVARRGADRRCPTPAATTRTPPAPPPTASQRVDPAASSARSRSARRRAVTLSSSQRPVRRHRHQRARPPGDGAARGGGRRAAARSTGRRRSTSPPRARRRCCSTPSTAPARRAQRRAGRHRRERDPARAPRTSCRSGRSRSAS